MSLVLLAALLRLLLIELPPADLLAPAADGRDHGFHGEEISRGNIAHELLHGPLMPILDYQWAAFFGGSLVTGILAVPSFACLGPSLFALKLVPILVSLLAPLLAFAILDRTASRRAAWIGAGLLAVTPPGYTTFTTVAWGTHAEGSVLTLLVFWLYVRARAAEAPRARDELLLGTALGFAVYYGYAALLGLATLALFELARDKLFFLSRRFALGLVGFAAGFAPWVAYNVRHGFVGLSVYEGSLLERLRPSEGGQVLANLGALVTERIPMSLGFRSLGPVPGDVLAPVLAGLLYALLVPALLALIPVARCWLRAFLARRAPPRIEHLNLLFPTYALLFVAVYARSWFFQVEETHLGHVRYLILLYPALALTTAVGLDRCLEGRPRARWPVRVALAGLLLSFGAGSMRLLDPTRAGHFRSTPAFDLFDHGRWLVWRFGTDTPRFVEIARRAITTRSPEHREELLAGMAHSLGSLSREMRRTDPRASDEVDAYRETRLACVRQLPAPYRERFRARPLQPRPERALDRR